MISDRLSQANWRKSTITQANGSCVELATDGRTWGAIRDSKQPDGGALMLPDVSFRAFIGMARSGQAEE
jgi:hypothetical protein